MPTNTEKDFGDIAKPRQTKTPRSYEAIEKGALALKLEDRVMLVNTLESANQAELKDRENLWKQAKDLVNGKE